MSAEVSCLAKDFRLQDVEDVRRQDGGNHVRTSRQGQEIPSRHS